MLNVRTSRRVSERDTKSEIWNEYNKLLSEVEGEPIALPLEEQKPAANKAIKDLSELKVNINDQLDGIAQEILSFLNRATELQNGLNASHQQILDYHKKQKELLENEIIKVRTKWEDEKEASAEQNEKEKTTLIENRKREQDEYIYNLTISRRKEEDEYEVKRIEKEKASTEREKILKNREDEIAQMENDSMAMPERIEKTVHEAKSELSKELVSKYTAEIHELKLIHEHEKKLIELKTANLESLAKSQSEEIESLKRQLTDSTKQVKEIAVSVIEGRAAASKAASTPTGQAEK